MMLHEAPRNSDKLVQAIEEQPQPSQELIEDLSQKQLKNIKRMLRSATSTHCL